ncbi:DUF6368 family protein [Streptomyces sp. NPDC046853]|uniref:DUF6368 family protein n=1 Tax=Streptomyces sp. NPDC046853 TaxID=3154920 RepID=UPI0033CD8452
MPGKSPAAQWSGVTARLTAAIMDVIGGVANAELREDQAPIVAGLPGVLVTVTEPHEAAYGSARFLRAWAAAPGFRLLKQTASSSRRRRAPSPNQGLGGRAERIFFLAPFSPTATKREWLPSGPSAVETEPRGFEGFPVPCDEYSMTMAFLPQDIEAHGFDAPEPVAEDFRYGPAGILELPWSSLFGMAVSRERTGPFSFPERVTRSPHLSPSV